MALSKLGKKPNIVIIFTDQEREVMHWPEGWAEENLKARKRLMDNGLAFTNAHCNTAACTPSRATLMTGLYPAQHRVKNLVFCDDPEDKAKNRTEQLSTNLPNIATVMAEAGYHVVLKGKFHLSRPVRWYNEEERMYWSEEDITFMKERYGFHDWNPPDMSDPMGLSDFGGGAINNDGRFVDGTGTAAGEYMPEDEQFRKSAVNFINTYDGDKPFCLLIGLVNPHDVQAYPGRGAQALTARKPMYEQGGYKLEDFKDLPIDLPPTIDEDLSQKPRVHSDVKRVAAIATGHVRTRERQRTYARFYAYLCREVDKQVGKVLDALDANGLTEDTIIIRTADHGELAMSHGAMRQKFYNAYRESLNVPLIISNPKLYPEPRKTASFGALIDILPTIASIGGVQNIERFNFRGHDLTPILEDPTAEVQDYIHFTYEDDAFPVTSAGCIRAIVEKDWKYAVYYDPFKGNPVEYEMYDLKNDPYESTNLAHPTNFKPAYAEERRRLHNRLIEVMKTHGTSPEEISFPKTEDYDQGYTVPGAVAHNPVPASIKRRQQFFTLVMVVATLATLYHVIFGGALVLGTIAALALGLVIGLFVFHRTTQLDWNEDTGEIVPKLDFAGLVILLLYVGLVIIGGSPFIARVVDPSTVNAANTSFIAGVMFGNLHMLRRKIEDILEPDETSDKVYSTRIDVDASPEEVWAVVTDFASYKSWNPLVTNVEGNHLSVGSSLRVKTSVLPMTLSATIKVVEENRQLEWEDHALLNLLTPVFSVNLLPLSEGRTRVIIQEAFTGPLMPLIGGRLDKQMPPQYDAMAQALAKQVEKNKKK